MQEAISYTSQNSLTRHDCSKEHLDASSSISSPDLYLGQRSDVIVEVERMDIVMRFRRKLENIHTKEAIIGRIISENAVVLIGRRRCCMCLVIRKLFQGIGVRPLVFEVEEGEEEEEIIRRLMLINQETNDGLGGISDVNDVRRMIELPAVVVGGYLFGGVEKVMATHVTGELVPIMKKAGALWL